MTAQFPIGGRRFTRARLGAVDPSGAVLVDQYLGGGLVELFGAGSVTVGSFTSVADGAVAVDGLSTGQIAPFGAAAVGDVAVTGTASTSIGAIGAAATGTSGAASTVPTFGIRSRTGRHWNARRR